MSEWTSRPRLERHSCRPNISTQTGHPNSDSAGLHRTAKLRQPQTQTRHAASDWAASGPTSSEAFERHVGSDRTVLDLGRDIPAQTRQRQTGHPSSDWTFHSRRANISPQIYQGLPAQTVHPSSDWAGTASDQTSKARLDIPTHTGQPRTGHPSSGPTASDSTAPRGTFKPRPDSHKDQTSRLRPDVPPQAEQPQTRHSSSHCAAIPSDRTFQLKPDSFRPAKLRLDRFRPDTPAQIGNHQWTGSDQTFQRRLESIESYCQAQAEHPSLRLDLTRASKLRPDRPALTGYLPSADRRSLVR